MENIKYLLNSPYLIIFIKCFAIILLGYLLGKVFSSLFTKVFENKLSRQTLLISKRLIFYSIFSIFLFTALKELKFDFSIFLGAAGVLSLAIGFASQTSASNIISGLFLVGEKPFEIGDIINVDDISGEVLSVDFLSVKLVTFENVMIRVPNETLIKAKVKNFTKFPIRRIDIQFRINYDTDIARMKEILLEIADESVLTLEDPSSLFILKELGEYGMKYQFSIWVAKENFLEVRNDTQEKIVKEFKANNIIFAYPKIQYNKLPFNPPS